MIVDAIVEAVVELRFETKSETIPELMYGRFADAAAWREYRQARLATADIPAVLRRIDPSLRFQPAIELVSTDGVANVRIGTNVMSYSHRNTYGGWENFGPETASAVRQLFRSVADISVTRIGIRYINALKARDHHVSAFSDLNLKIQVGDQEIAERLNVNYKSVVEGGFEITTRLATLEFAEGIVPEGSTALVDIDVYTTDGFSTTDQYNVIDLIDKAHDLEKRQFFKVLGPVLTEKLRAE